MTKIKPGLGRGLGALINPSSRNTEDQPIAVAQTEIKKDDGNSVDILAKIEVINISPNPFQPRSEFDQKSLDELKKSILQNGLIQPITVRRLENKHYELISGERRLRACKEIGYKEIPAYIIEVQTKEAMVALSLIENLQREDLNPIEVAVSYRRLIEECGLSQEEVAEKVGKERSTITNSIRLLKLPEKIQNGLIKSNISAGHARALLGLSNQKHQLKLYDKIISNGLSVRKVEELVRDFVNKTESIKQNVFNKSNVEDASLKDIENKLRNVFGTKVMCKQKKNGTGTITIEFYSQDELERLFELFDIIEKANF